MNFRFRNDLAAISASVFTEGMEIQTGIYAKNGYEYVLICKDVVLTPALIQKIKQFSSRKQDIYIEKNAFKDILGENLRIRNIVPNETVTDFINEPLKPDEMKEAIAIEADYQIALSDAETMLDQVVADNIVSNELTDQVVSSVGTQLLNCSSASLLQCINSIRRSDHYLFNHCIDVAVLNGLIARWIKLPPEDVATAIKIGFLHDIGKLKMPPEILNKPGALTREEYEIAKLHPIASCDILINSGETDQHLLKCIRAHHEHVNGTGYPDHLTWDEIPLLARITAVSDVYSAMVSKRVYKPQHSPFEILSEFAQNRFSDLDYSIVSVFLKNMPEEFIGKSVLLSNGEIAKVAYVNPIDFTYPIVRTKRGLEETGPDLFCISMSNPTSIFIESPDDTDNN